MNSAMNDMLSANSLRHQNAGGSALGGEGLGIYSPQTGASPGAPHTWEENGDIGMDPNLRQQ